MNTPPYSSPFTFGVAAAAVRVPLDCPNLVGRVETDRFVIAPDTTGAAVLVPRDHPSWLHLSRDELFSDRRTVVATLAGPGPVHPAHRIKATGAVLALYERALGCDDISAAIARHTLTRLQQHFKAFLPVPIPDACPQHADYTHTALFGFLYARTLGLIVDTLTEFKGPLRVVDLGAGHGLLAASVGHALSLRGLADRVTFVCVENDPTALALARDLCTDLASQVEFIAADIAAPGFGDQLRATAPDLVIAHHVLEHLADDDLNNRYLHDWLHAARVGVIASVPLDDEPARSVSSHRRAFSATDVAQLSVSMCERCADAIVDDRSVPAAGLLTWRRDDHVLAHGGFSGDVKTLEVRPQVPAPRLPPHRLAAFFQRFDPRQFARGEGPLVVARIKDKATFASVDSYPRQGRQLVIKLPGTPVQLPTELHQFNELLQKVIDHNASINPAFEESFVRLSFFRGDTVATSERNVSLQPHPDQLPSLKPEFAPGELDFTYTCFNTNPTLFFLQPFDITNDVEKARSGLATNLYDTLAAQADRAHAVEGRAFDIHLSDCYLIHSAQPATTRVDRVFVKIDVSRRRTYDNRELRYNPAFPEVRDWGREGSLGYINGHYQHRHINECLLTSKVALVD